MASTIVARPSKSAVTNTRWTGYVAGLLIVVVLAFVARFLKSQIYGIQLPLGIPGKALEYPLWAAAVGLVANWVLARTGLHQHVRSGFRTELFLKTGLVLLGATISFRTLATAAGGALLQALIMITSVFFFSWWLGGKFRLPDTVRAVMSTAVSVCGVSAAIAAAGATLAKKEEVSYVTALVILVALPLMVIAPLLAGVMQLSPAVAGAWFGGNIDTTAAVVGAGTIYGQTAQQVAGIVKQTQNALIGIVAFLLAGFFSTKESGSGKRVRPSAAVLWERFPKFVLGFVVASLVVSFGLIGKEAGVSIASLKDWAFAFAFVAMGLEFSAGEFREMGWKPVAVFLIVTVFNTVLALGVSTLIFGYLFTV